MRVAVTTLRGGAPAGPPGGGDGGAPVFWAAAAKGAPTHKHHITRFRRVAANRSGSAFHYGMLTRVLRLQPALKFREPYSGPPVRIPSGALAHRGPAALLTWPSRLVTRGVGPREGVPREPPLEGREQRAVAARVGIGLQRPADPPRGDPHEVDLDPLWCRCRRRRGRRGRLPDLPSVGDVGRVHEDVAEGAVSGRREAEDDAAAAPGLDA